MSTLPPRWEADFERLLAALNVSSDEVTTAHKLAWFKSMIDRHKWSYSRMRDFMEALRSYGTADPVERAIEERLLRTYLRQEFEAGRIIKTWQPVLPLSTEAFAVLIDLLQAERTTGLTELCRDRLFVGLLLTWHTGILGTGYASLFTSDVFRNDSSVEINYRMASDDDPIVFKIDRTELFGDVTCDALRDWLSKAPRNDDSYVIPALRMPAMIKWGDPAGRTQLALSLRHALSAAGYRTNAFTFGSIRKAFDERMIERYGPAALYYVSRNRRTYSWLLRAKRRYPDWNDG